MPLPIIPTPFQRIAMDIVGPLLKSQSGKQYILVVCDYSTCYPEAIPLRSIEAEHIAEELVHIFLRVGISEEILTDQGTTAKPSKCRIAAAQCSYLGHIVGNGEVRPELDKVKAVADFPRPENIKDVRAFFGLSGYYRRFLPNYATTALPLTDLMKKRSTGSKQITWTSECEVAFKQLKTQLVKETVLKSPDFNKSFILQTDVSNCGVGAVLNQQDSEETEHPIGYFSRKLLPREERYATVGKECLAIKLGIQAFHVYLLGKPFEIQTDHRSLEWLHRMKGDNGRLMRWSLTLQPYNFTVTYRPGKKMLMQTDCHGV